MKVAVLMGSESDKGKMAPAAATLAEFGIEVDERVLSAHRTPDQVAALARGARADGYVAFICGAGMAAHLAGAVAPSTESTPSTPPFRCRRASPLPPWPSTAP